ncbi:MAG: TerB family tellurite resistance protein [Chitinophagales bacterium]
MSQETYTTKSEHKCPYCQKEKLETVATAPYVRGFLLAYQIGHNSFIGCVPCVRKKLLGEAGISALIGWFSITAFLINPFLIVYNLIQAAFLKYNPQKVKAKLKEVGIPENLESINLTQIGYALAISMIKADGKVEESEIKQAEEIGEKIFKDFDEAKFRMMLNEQKDVPSIRDLAVILNDVLNEEGKLLIFKYLFAIAQADGNIDSSEALMLSELATVLSIQKEQLT